MTISEAIAAVLHSLDIDEQNFRQVLRGNHPDMVAMRAALVQLADAVMDSDDRELLIAAKNEINALRSELCNAYGTPIVCSAVACAIEDRLKEK